MPLEERDKAYLWDMLEASRAVERFVHGKTYDDYLSDELLRSGVERQIEIIGEAARRISSQTRESHPEIPWQGIIGQRNVLAHEYDEILHDLVWAIATQRIKGLIEMLREILPDDGEID